MILFFFFFFQKKKKIGYLFFSFTEFCSVARPDKEFQNFWAKNKKGDKMKWCEAIMKG